MLLTEVIGLLLGQLAVMAFIVLFDAPMACGFRYPYASLYQVIAW
jgi:hypothetical protein